MPGGKATLVIETRAAGEEGEEEEEEEHVEEEEEEDKTPARGKPKRKKARREETAAAVTGTQSYTGIGIKVRLSIMHELSWLSAFCRSYMC